MGEEQIAIREMRKHLEHGEIKSIARKHRVPLWKAYELMEGKRKMTDSDEPFVMACYDKALPRKVRRSEKLKQFAQ